MQIRGGCKNSRKRSAYQINVALNLLAGFSVKDWSCIEIRVALPPVLLSLSRGTRIIFQLSNRRYLYENNQSDIRIHTCCREKFQDIRQGQRGTKKSPASWQFNIARLPGQRYNESNIILIFYIVSCKRALAEYADDSCVWHPAKTSRFPLSAFRFTHAPSFSDSTCWGLCLFAGKRTFRKINT